MIKHLLTDFDLNREEVLEILNLAEEIKKKPQKFSDTLRNKTLAMYFEKTSTRTRTSFEVAMTQLGGHAIYLDARTTQAAKGETLSDIAKTLSRYCDGIMARMYKQTDLEEIAKAASIPVINGLTDDFHPCQTLGDLLTVKEKKGDFNGKISYVGDCGCNTAHSTMIGFSKMGMNVNLICPAIKKYQPKPEILEKAKKEAKAEIKIINSLDGVKDSDVIYTDTWVSMGMEKEAEQRIKDLRPYQVNSDLVKQAKKDVLIMHCLPAYRNYEITADVLDGPNSIIWDQAENRLHIQKAILLTLIKKT
jgi:ornithine carbamoyltransferase